MMDDRCFFCKKNHAYQTIRGKPVCIICALPYQIGLEEGRDEARLESMNERIGRMEDRLARIERDGLMEERA